MNRIWAPWRMKYITNRSDDTPDTGCVFCAAATGDDDTHLVIVRAEHTYTIMNLFPYTNGHLMIVPIRHVAGLSDLTTDEHLELMQGASTAVDVLGAMMACDGYNVGMNLGRAAGAGIASHLHLHVGPRWVGDTNFMPVVGDNRVISESLEDSYGKLRDEYARRGLV